MQEPRTPASRSENHTRSRRTILLSDTPESSSPDLYAIPESEFASDTDESEHPDPDGPPTPTNYPTLISRFGSRPNTPQDNTQYPDDTNTLQNPIQRRLRQLLRKYDLPQVLEEIKAADQEYCPHPSASRVHHYDFVRQGLIFLAGTEQQFLEQLLECTAPWTSVIAGTGVTVEQLNKLSKDYKNKNKGLTPGIYMNLLAPRNGMPLVKEEMRRCLDGFEHLVHGGHEEQEFWPLVVVDADPDDPRFDGEHHTTLSEGAKRFYGEKVLKESWEVKMMSFSAKFKESAKIMVDAHRKLIAEAGPEILYFPFGGESGWASSLLVRLGQHLKNESPNQALVIMRCVANYLYPAYDIQLHQLSVFVTHPSQAPAGETIGTHLVGGYPRYGGFNYETAGISVTKASKMSGYEWQEVQYDTFRWQGPQQEANLQRVRELYQKREKKARERLACRESKKRIQEAERDRDAVEEEVLSALDEEADLLGRCKKAAENAKGTAHRGLESDWYDWCRTSDMDMTVRNQMKLIGLEEVGPIAPKMLDWEPCGDE